MPLSPWGGWAIPGRRLRAALNLRSPTSLCGLGGERQPGRTRPARDSGHQSSMSAIRMPGKKAILHFDNANALTFAFVATWSSIPPYRNGPLEVGRLLEGKRYLIHDRDSLFNVQIRGALAPCRLRTTFRGRACCGEKIWLAWTSCTRAGRATNPGSTASG